MRLTTAPDNITIQLDRTEQLAALKAKLIVRRSEIVSIRWYDIFEEWRRWEVRLPGASIPGRIIAGSYWTEEGWDFLYIRRPIGITNTIALNVIVFELSGHDKFTRIIISSSEEVFAHLHKWFEPKASKAKKRSPVVSKTTMGKKPTIKTKAKS